MIKMKLLKKIFFLLSLVLATPSVNGCSCSTKKTKNSEIIINNTDPTNISEAVESGEIVIPPVLPEGVDEDAASYVYATVALDLVGYGYDVFNA